jgi:hypothetical protein
VGFYSLLGLMGERFMFSIRIVWLNWKSSWGTLTLIWSVCLLWLIIHALLPRIPCSTSSR